MDNEIQSIIRRIENVNSGEPWFGRAVYSILEEVDAKKVYIKPNNTDWKKGVTELKAIHEKIIVLLNKEDSDFLEQKVDFRNYNFRFLINGMIGHNIYHLGQIAYVKKLLN